MLEKLIFIRSRFGIATGRANNRYFVRREYSLAEFVFTVALTKRTMQRNSHTGEETERILAKDRNKFFAFSPVVIFVIPKDNNT